MYRKFPFLLFITVLQTLLASSVFAQNLFIGTQPSNTSTNNTAQSSSGFPAISGKTLSPSDFAKDVSQAGAQQDASFRRQMNQQLSQVPKVTAPGIKESAGTSTPTTPKTNSAIQAPAQTQTQTQTESETSTSPQYSDHASTTQPAAPATQPTAPTPQPSQIYTGFPAQAPASSSGSQTSGNWNIKY